jgi:predicted enzyme related to lactoylglutathione lyase
MTDTVTEAAPAAADAGCGKAHGQYIWYELMTPDPQGAKAFYEAVVPGWSIGERNPGPIDYRMIERSDGGNAGGVLGLGDGGPGPRWHGYISVDDVDATIGQIEAKGGKAHMPANDIPGVGRIAMVADPHGNSFYVMTPRPPAGQEGAQSDVFSEDQEQRVGWNELTTADPVAARQFYGELFGWDSDEFMPMGEYGEYRFLAHDGTRFGAMCGVMPGGSAGWRYYIRVPSISQSAEAVKAAGGTVSMGPHEVPGGDMIIIGNDPQGAEFALVGKA